MRKLNYYSLYYADLGLFILLFLLHRSFTFAHLNAEVLTGSRQWSGFFVGALSDVWISGLLSLVTAGFSTLIGSNKFRIPFFVVFTLLLASHQSYVEFFGFTMMAFHLRYLYDSAFLMANGRSLLSWPIFAYFGLLILLLILQRKSGRVKKRKKAAWVFTGVLLLLVFLHNRNIHWRVQWFIPENLQMNLVEKLYEQVRHAKAIDPITPVEQARLAELLGLPEVPVDFPALVAALGRSGGAGLPPESIALRAAWQKDLAAGSKPMMAVMLLESLRPAETGYFTPSAPSLTPTLDDLARRGIVFTSAYSTGSVTRGGQEAVFCGHWSSRDTSLMRYDAIAPIRCLPDLLPADKNETFWYHGGNGLFDNQLSFWRKHGMKETLTQDQFSSVTPLTSWGIGDISFLKRAAADLQKRREQTTAEALVGLFLTVSNHIPWDMPADVIPLSLPESTHPSYRTTAYADHAVRIFVERLKAAGIWEHSLLFLVSDHGNLLPPYQNLYGQSPAASARLQSHVNFIISGGLAEQAIGPRVVHTLVSQADVSRVIAETLDLKDFVSMGANPFQQARRLPVLARLEQHLFDPASEQQMDPKAWQSKPVAGPEEKDLLLYRAYLNYINTR